MRNLIMATMALTLTMTAPALSAGESIYTDFKVDACKSTLRGGEDEEGSIVSVQCIGYGGMPYVFALDDLRSQVAFGDKGSEHCAFKQTFPRFNSVGNKIEWRIANSKPIATIFRWSVHFGVDDAPKRRSWLVVTKIEPQNSCHMGYVEGSLPNANEKARSLADSAANFSCKGGVPIVLAKPETDVTSVASPTGCGNE